MKLKEMMRYLPDIFNKTEDSNVSKLLSLFNAEYNSLRSLAEKISLWRSIDLAEGKVLDEIGAQYGEYRGNFSDEFYRFVIKMKIAQRKADGSVNQLMWIINYTLNVPYEDIDIVSLRKWEGDDTTGEYQAIAIKNLPAKFLPSGTETGNYITFISDSVAAGIRLGEVSFLSENRHTMHIAAAMVVTEIVTITHDYNATTEINTAEHQAAGLVVTEIVTLTHDYDDNAEIRTAGHHGAALIATETVTITNDYDESSDIHSTGHHGSTAVVTEIVEIH